MRMRLKLINIWMRAFYYKYLFCKYFFSKSKTSIEYIHRYVHLCVGEHRDQNQVSFLPLHITFETGFPHWTWGLANSGRPPGQQAPGTLLSQGPRCWSCKYLPAFYTETSALNCKLAQTAFYQLSQTPVFQVKSFSLHSLAGILKLNRRFILYI